MDVGKASPGVTEFLPHPLELDDHLWVLWFFNLGEVLTQVLGLSGQARCPQCPAHTREPGSHG